MNWAYRKEEGAVVRIVLCNSWRLTSLEEIRKEKALTQPLRRDQSLVIDGSELKAIDTAGAMLLGELLKKLGHKPSSLKYENFEQNHENILTLVEPHIDDFDPHIVTHDKNIVIRIGLATGLMLAHIKGLLSFLGKTITEVVNIILGRRTLRVRELFVQLELTCINAIPIIALVTFLIGVVIAYLFASQAEQYGASIYIVEAVSRSMCRELSPIIVAVVVAGRSGSAFTAQIGTMKLNEEIDAIVTMGLSPFQVLVLPRVLALIIAMPILVFVGDVVGIYGGMFIAEYYLGITRATFIDRLSDTLPLVDLMVGLIKAPVFAIFIAMIGCRMGFIVEKNARSLGLNTTSTVVQSIVAVILLNAAFAIVFIELGLY